MLNLGITQIEKIRRKTMKVINNVLYVFYMYWPFTYIKTAYKKIKTEI